jgi:glycosyltransferase involved in cell wall biosynthesis
MEIGYIGRIEEPKKGIFTLLQTALRLPDHQFTVIGNGKDKIWLQAWATARGLENVRFLEETPYPPFGYFDIIVVPSRWEGFGIVILEAMQAGAVVIAANVGGIPEIIKHSETGFLFHPNDPDHLKDIIDHLTFSPKLMERVKEKGRERAKDFNIKSTLDGLEKIYKEVLSR